MMLNTLCDAGTVEPDLEELAGALSAGRALEGWGRQGGDAALGEWVSRIVTIVGALETDAREPWAAVPSLFRTFSSVRSGGDCQASELVELAELADLVTICSQSNRAAPLARDLVGRFFRKSIEQGAFYRDVRMTPQHFDQLVARVAPHLPAGLRGPAAIPPRWRIFTVLFWLAQGGRQRVVARAVDIAESTLSKICTPVVNALICGLPCLTWPDHAERQRIGEAFSNLTGGNLSGWRGLYGTSALSFALHSSCAAHHCIV